jgi:hypothetical protein
MYSLRQARHLGGLHRTAPVPCTGSCCTSALHPAAATPVGVYEWLKSVAEEGRRAMRSSGDCGGTYAVTGSPVISERQCAIFACGIGQHLPWRMVQAPQCAQAQGGTTP